MCLLLIVPSFTFNKASAQGKGASISLKGESKEIVANKIPDRLSTQFSKDGEKVTFLIKFKEQVDTMAVAKNASETAKAKAATSNQVKLMKRNAIVSELRATALETQGNVKDYLEKEMEAGNAKDIQSFYVVNGMAVTATKEVMEKLAEFPEVEKILPNEVRQLNPTVESNTNSVGLAVQDSKPAAGFENIEWNIDQIGAPQVWEMGVDGTGTVVASIDTGVQWNHPALMEQYRGFDSANPENPNHEYNWFDATSNQSAPYDDQGHGTHVTGTMVGAEPNGANQIGVAPGAKWIAVKAFTAAGGTDTALLAAGEWILAPKDASGNPNPAMAPDVVNNSWGGGPGMDEWYRPMVQAWRAAEIFPEFSAGNTRAGNPGGPGSVANPANYPESFATGATDINMNLASFSLQGPSPYGELKPEISAPGVNIRSSVPGSGYEGGWNGTSMAGPHVSAVVALLKQVNSSLTVDEIAEILTTTATPLTDSTFPESPNNGYGYGLVNAYDAVSSIISGLGKIKGQVAKDGEDTEAPTFDHAAPTETYAGMDLPLSIDVQDNVSISSVTLQYQDADGNWVDVEATRTSGSYNDATFSASIPGEAIAIPSVSYKWHIVDFGGNEVTSDTVEVSVQPGITLGYSQDFESDPIGWYSFGANDTWEWGAPTSGPESAFSGEKVYATTLAGNYGNSANMTLVMPPVDLPADSAAYLQFMNWHSLETRWDFGHVFVSTDQENWTQLFRFDGVTTDWTAREIDLSEYAGQRIYIGFNVTTDGSVVRPGWYIDDVALSAESIGEEEAAAQLGVQKEEKVAVKEEKVNPDNIHPVSTPVTEEAVEDEFNPAALPLNAQVTVIESNRSVKTNPANGQYELLHAAGTFTVRAESYGYYPAEQTVEIPDRKSVV